MAKSNKEEEKYILLFQQWKRKKDKIFLTNDFGGRIELADDEFVKILDNPSLANIPEKCFNGGFVSERLDTQNLGISWLRSHCNICLAPILQIIVLTMRCNMQCVYCQAGSPGKHDASFDMSLETARKSVDFAFNTPSPVLNFEFQGGEPLLNWNVLSKTIEYIRSKEEETGKKTHISLISNFLLMDEKKADFLLQNEVTLCSSLDGPECVHKKNRHSENDISYETVRKWLKYFRKKHDSQSGSAYRVFKPGAIVTVTKHSLNYAKDIIDEYISAGMEHIYLRPVSKIGYAAKNWDSIGVSPEEFLSFYKQALLYILDLNKKGTLIREKACMIFCDKILQLGNGGNYDIDSPCGAGTGQIAYNYDGNIYTCDEARMLAMEGDDLFRIGNVNDPVEKVLTADAVRACKYASELNSQPLCSRCAYKPYCGICPVFNYATQGSLSGNMATNFRCAVNKGQLDLIFDILENKENEEIIRKWFQD